MSFRNFSAALLMVVASSAGAQHELHGGQQHSMNHGMGQGMHHMHMMGHGAHSASSQPTEGGQAAFAAIQEIVALLEADPDTDWSMVNIDALRTHLIDMDLVMMKASAHAETIEGGARYHVTGDTQTSAAIKRMVPAHALQVSADSSWQATTEEMPNGVTLTITSADANDVAKIRALGFAGFMVQGNHHQPHHKMMATGGMNHEHGHNH